MLPSSRTEARFVLSPIQTGVGYLNSYQKKIRLKIIVFKLQSMGDGAIGSQLVLITVSMNLTERSNRFVIVITRCQNMEETCVQNLISTKDSFHVMQQITKV